MSLWLSEPCMGLSASPTVVDTNQSRASIYEITVRFKGYPVFASTLNITISRAKFLVGLTTSFCLFRFSSILIRKIQRGDRPVQRHRDVHQHSSGRSTHGNRSHAERALLEIRRTDEPSWRVQSETANSNLTYTAINSCMTSLEHMVLGISMTIMHALCRSRLSVMHIWWLEEYRKSRPVMRSLWRALLWE